MSSFDSIFATMAQRFFDAFGSTIVYSADGDSDGVPIVGVWRSGDEVQAQHPGAFGELLVLESDFETFPTKRGMFTINSETFVIAKEPLDCRDGIGGIRLQLRKR